MPKKDQIELFVNSSSSGEGKENLKASYNSEDLMVGFNSRYLLDIASEIKDQKCKNEFKRFSFTCLNTR